MVLKAIDYSEGSLKILNQLLLPTTSEFIQIREVSEAADAIKSMKVYCNAFTNFMVNKGKGF